MMQIAPNTHFQMFKNQKITKTTAPALFANSFPGLRKVRTAALWTKYTTSTAPYFFFPENKNGKRKTLLNQVIQVVTFLIPWSEVTLPFTIPKKVPNSQNCQQGDIFKGSVAPRLFRRRHLQKNTAQAPNISLVKVGKVYQLGRVKVEIL